MEGSCREQHSKQKQKLKKCDVHQNQQVGSGGQDYRKSLRLRPTHWDVAPEEEEDHQEPESWGPNTPGGLSGGPRSDLYDEAVDCSMCQQHLKVWSFIRSQCRRSGWCSMITCSCTCLDSSCSIQNHLKTCSGLTNPNPNPADLTEHELWGGLSISSYLSEEIT